MLSTPRHKVSRVPEFKEVVYDYKVWKTLEVLRGRALNIMLKLRECGFEPIAHGSVARGDVTPKSDVDVVITYSIQPYKVEVCLERSGLKPFKKYLVQATPSSTPKAYVELDAEGLTTVSFPILNLSQRELEFYRFGGLVDVNDLIKGVRKPGVNKNLILIVPTDSGHREAPVVGYEPYVANVLNISLETVLERVRVLTRRDDVGRTGTFLNYVLNVDESFEEALAKLVKSGRLKLMR